MTPKIVVGTKMKLKWSSVNKLLIFYQSLIDKGKPNSLGVNFIKKKKGTIEKYRRGEAVTVLTKSDKDNKHLNVMIGKMVLTVRASDLTALN